jgi:catechol 2,3-dioxygenase-like lactoylglutathione lyase family enzyme
MVRIRCNISLQLLFIVFGSVAGLLGQSAPAIRVEAVGFTVSDMDRSIDFYTRVLHFQKLSDVEHAGTAIEHLKGVFGTRIRVVRMKLGEEQIELSEYLAPRGRAVPADAQSNDLSFQHIAIVVRDMDQAYAWLRQNHVHYVSIGPQTLPAWNLQAGGIQAFYFTDPDNHVLEIIHFPAGKGDPRWQQAAAELFEGIDHTAIAVSDTDKSIAFYKDELGMRIIGTSENYGDEQEHLNNVFGARLRITSLRAPQGPGVELLEYLVPRTGKPIPPGQRANDLAHWETLIDEKNVESAWSYFTANHAHIISTQVESIDGNDGSAREGFLLQDPDGHVIAAMNEVTVKNADSSAIHLQER